MSGAFLSNENPSCTSKKEGRVTAAVAKARYTRVTENQTKQTHQHSARSCTNNTVIKVLLDSESDCDLMFHEKETNPTFAHPGCTYLHMTQCVQY
jgi:hypothetical protein